MSSDQTLTSALRDLRDQYRRQSLEARLEDVAEDLRDIKLQLAIMGEMFGDGSSDGVAVNRELAEMVQSARSDVASNDWDALEDRIGELEQRAESERASVEQSLSQELVSRHDQVNAMLRLNENLDVYDQASLRALEVLLDKWNWKEAASIEDIDDFEAQLGECREFGADMRNIYQEAQDAIIAPLVDEGIKDVVDDLLESELVYIDELSDAEREKLIESELGDHIRLALG